MAQKFIKDVSSTLDYQIDWSDWLGTDGDTIVTSTWVAENGIDIDSDSYTTTTATIWLSGGVAGQKYRITNHIVTDAGREDERSIRVEVGQR